MGEPRNSSRLRRLRGEPTSDDPVSQSYGFIRQCLEEGIEDNEIVIMAREHQPTRGRFDPAALDGMIEHMIKKFRDQGVGASTAVGPQYLSWTDRPEGTLASTWCIDGFIEAGASVSLVGQAKVGKSLFALEAAAAKASGAEFLVPSWSLRPSCTSTVRIVREQSVSDWLPWPSKPVTWNC